MLRSPGIVRLLYQNSDAVTAVFEAFGQAEGGGMTRPDALRFAKVRRLLQGGVGGGYSPSGIHVHLFWQGNVPVFRGVHAAFVAGSGAPSFLSGFFCTQ